MQNENESDNFIVRIQQVNSYHKTERGSNSADKTYSVGQQCEQHNINVFHLSY